MVVGVRPEQIGLSLTPLPGGIEFSVYAALPAGSELIVHARRDNLMFTVKEIRPLRVDIDRPIWLSFAPETFNLYDPVTTRLVASGSGPPAVTLSGATAEG